VPSGAVAIIAATTRPPLGRHKMRPKAAGRRRPVVVAVVVVIALGTGTVRHRVPANLARRTGTATTATDAAAAAAAPTRPPSPCQAATPPATNTAPPPQHRVRGLCAHVISSVVVHRGRFGVVFLLVIVVFSAAAAPTFPAPSPTTPPVTAGFAFGSPAAAGTAATPGPTALPSVLQV